MNSAASLHEAILDSLDWQVAALNQDGHIVYVNSAWKQFAADNGLSVDIQWIGCDYLKACTNAAEQGDSMAAESLRGILSVLSGQQLTYHYEYACHSPYEKRWFMMQMKALSGGPANLFIVTHFDITQRKLTEQKVDMLSRTDPLTGLFNRREFNEFIAKEWRRAHRESTTISIVMLDTDHFKSYNDEFGHLAGDECLRQIAKTLTTFARRPNDLVVRFGGDEFALILGNTSAHEAHRIAESICSAVQDENMCYSGNGRITISAGVAAIIPVKELSARDLIRNADQALYRAKEQGGNCVVMVSHERGA